jgi:lipid-A-disaccharide synthase-like uncharacterized protein
VHCALRHPLPVLFPRISVSGEYITLLYHQTMNLQQLRVGCVILVMVVLTEVISFDVNRNRQKLVEDGEKREVVG